MKTTSRLISVILFSALINALDADGIEAAAKVMMERKEPQGTRVNYASAETDMLAAVLHERPA
jgi:hypothetical protein